MTAKKELKTIGRNAAVDFVGHISNIPAKVDTGADSSSVWASNVSVDTDGILRFCLLGPQSPHFTGEVLSRESYGVAMVRSGSGHVQIRYRATFSFRVDGRRVRATLNLADRSGHKFPVLIGRRTLAGKFVVDVSRAHYTDKEVTRETEKLNDELKKDPYAFYKKYYGKDVE